MAAKNSFTDLICSFCNYYTQDNNYKPSLILFGFAKILGMGDNQIDIVVKEEECRQYIRQIRTAFDEKELDPVLIRKVIPLVMSRMTSSKEADNYCSKLIEEGFVSTSPQTIIDRIFSNNELGYFKKGNDVSGIMAKMPLPQKTEQSGSSESRVDSEEPKNDSSAPESEAKSVSEKEETRFIKLSEEFNRIRKEILSEVDVQPRAVDEFLRGCLRGELFPGMSDNNRAKAVFVFMGHRGSGKSHLARAAIRHMGRPGKVFNMVEYSNYSALSDFMGSRGALSSFIKGNPKSIVVFDNIEYASNDLLGKMGDILDKGCYSSDGNEYSLKDCIVIFITNTGKHIFETESRNISEISEAEALDAIINEKAESDRYIFPHSFSEKLALGNVILFDYVNTSSMISVVKKRFSTTAQEMENRYGYTISIDKKLPLMFLLNQGEVLNMQVASRHSVDFLNKEFYEISAQLSSHPDFLKDIKKISFELELGSAETPDEIKELFVASQEQSVMVICSDEYKKFFDKCKCRVIFPNTIEAIKAFINDVDVAIVDPCVGYDESTSHGISLEDSSCFGVKALKSIADSDFAIPLYVLKSGDALSTADYNAFLRLGAVSSITLNTDAEAFGDEVSQLSDNVILEKKWLEFASQGQTLKYNTAQIISGDTLIIQYYDFVRRSAVDLSGQFSVISDAERPTELFDDVIGAENAKDELKYFISFLSNPQKFIKDGGKPAKGLLLYGPPGTGKTMLARAMAGESKVSFIQMNSTEFMSKWVGESEENVRRLFRRAHKYAPTIIFIDEIDAIGKTRTGQDPHTESLLNALLTEIDGFKINLKKPVFVVAATNYSISGESGMSLDPALVRRFDNKILVDLPNEKERAKYIKKQAEKKGYKDIGDEVIKNVASRTPGFSLAIIQNILGLAYRNAQKRGCLPNGDDLQNALEEYNYGEKHEWNEEYYRAVSIHESGHAYIASLSGEKPSYMTIESRGDFGGYMAHENREDKPNYTKDELIWRIRCALGGRAAEEVFFGKKEAVNTGASSDLRNATDCALRMICTYGMTDDMLVSIPVEEVMKSELGKEYIQMANELIIREMEETVKLITEGKETVKRLADALLSNNHLTGSEIEKILGL